MSQGSRFPSGRAAVRPWVVTLTAIATTCSALAAARAEPSAGSGAHGDSDTKPVERNTISGARGALVGRVVMADGRPAVSATISIAASGGEVARVETDDAGRFRVEGLASGSYEITAVALTGERGLARIAIKGDRDGERELELQLAGAAGMVGETIEVRGKSAEVERRQSAEAVTVVSTERAKRETADLGEVLARTNGVSVRRSGGLGSRASLSLAGLTEDQIRFFMDGLPLAMVGFPFGVANVPVNLIDRVEVYNGVVPARFGADALGGAVNLVTNDNAPGTHGAASLEMGSFDTERVTLSARHRAASGLYARLDGFIDHARNDYVVSAKESDSTGQLTNVRVPLFHDAYAAGGGAVEVGAVDQPWAQRLTLRGFASGYDKQVQSDPLMERVYGEVTREARTLGGTARFQQHYGDVAVDVTGGYVLTRGQFRDVSTCAYNWFGQCFAHNDAGEIGAQATDERTRDHTGLARLAGRWAVVPHQALRLSIAL